MDKHVKGKCCKKIFKQLDVPVTTAAHIQKSLYTDMNIELQGRITALVNQRRLHAADQGGRQCQK